MDDILTSLADPRLIAALEANLEEEMMYFGHTLAGAEIYDDGEIEGFVTRRGHLNGILRTHLRETAPAAVQARIENVLAYFRARTIDELGWSVGQDCQPPGMGLYLERQGFRRLEEENIGLALNLDLPPAEDVRVAGL